jgi:hypothetical protein
MITVSRESFLLCLEYDDSADVSYLDQEDYTERRAAFRREEFHFVGIRARCEILVPASHAGHSYVIPLTSAGCWGIESDAGDDYLQEVFDAECEELETVLRALGVEITREAPEQLRLPFASGSDL